MSWSYDYKKYSTKHKNYFKKGKINQKWKKMKEDLKKKKKKKKQRKVIL